MTVIEGTLEDIPQITSWWDGIDSLSKPPDLRREVPKCGRGKLFHRYLTVVQQCSACGERYGHYRADDAPPWLTILLVGHITIPMILIIEEGFEPPLSDISACETDLVS